MHPSKMKATRPAISSVSGGNPAVAIWCTTTPSWGAAALPVSLTFVSPCLVSLMDVIGSAGLRRSPDRTFTQVDSLMDQSCARQGRAGGRDNSRCTHGHHGRGSDGGEHDKRA